VVSAVVRDMAVSPVALVVAVDEHGALHARGRASTTVIIATRSRGGLTTHFARNTSRNRPESTSGRTALDVAGPAQRALAHRAHDPAWCR
jgi:hypothetical protein